MDNFLAHLTGLNSRRGFGQRAWRGTNASPLVSPVRHQRRGIGGEGGIARLFALPLRKPRPETHAFRDHRRTWVRQRPLQSVIAWSNQRIRMSPSLVVN